MYKKECCCDECCQEIRKPLIGQQIEDFELNVFHNNDEKRVKLSDYKGKWLILFFYPKDFTFVCPTELGELADMYPQFKEKNAEIMSVSTDTVVVHKAWHDATETIGKIKYPMAADPTGALCKYLGTYIEDEGVSYRGTFIINPEGTIITEEIHPDGIGRNAKELFRKLQAAQFVQEHGDQVCPASWTPGDDTLKPGLDLVGKL